MDMNQLVSIFCEIDDFCNELEQHCRHYMLTGPTRVIEALHVVSISEIMTILVMFQMSRFRDFKNVLCWFSQFLSQELFS